MTKKKTAKKDSGLKICGKIFLLSLWVVVSVIAVQLIVGYLLILLLGKTVASRPVWVAVYSAVSYILAMILIIWVPIAIKKKQIKTAELREDLGLIDLPTWTDIGLAPVGFIVSTLLAAGLVAVFSFFPWFNAEEAQAVGFNQFLVGSDRAFAFITLVVLAPIAEEIIFRGFLYGKIRNLLHGKIADKWGIIIAILIVSILFGVIHLQWNVGVNVFAMSVVLCALREITGTIYAGILTHMVKNGIAFFLLYVIGIH